MHRYFAEIGDKCSTGTFNYTHFKSGRIRGDVGFCDGCNNGFQGLTADGARNAHFNVMAECYGVPDSPLYGCRPVLFVHDEIIIEAPAYRAHEAVLRLRELMLETMAKWIPDVPLAGDVALMRRWYKGANEVRDASGRIIPWEPTEKTT